MRTRLSAHVPDFPEKWENGETQNLVCFIFIPGRVCVQKHGSGTQAQRGNYAVIQLI